jgi:hypothetical protein
MVYALGTIADLGISLTVTSFGISIAVSSGALPSNCSTFLATLNINPREQQVKINELPPMLIKGKVTPVTGTMFTVTAILATACMIKVKLKPKARNATKA